MNKLRSQYRQSFGDRRKLNVIYKAPFFDSDGVLVRADRRIRAERRVFNEGADIVVTEHIEL